MKYLIAIFVVLLLVGCSKPVSDTITGAAIEHQIESNSGQDVDVDVSDGEMTVTTDDGEVHVEVTGTGSNHWCQEGAEWKWTSTAPQQSGSGQWVIKGIVSSGEYAGLCHVAYTAQAEGQEMKMDYYFSENSETGYMVMDMNGQTFKQEWHK